ncbi:MAG: hypothetical protein HOP19_15565 [Acidobacteria bacterium]|nr:hypothetical protein [Acidobacteriota bacterium]
MANALDDAKPFLLTTVRCLWLIATLWLCGAAYAQTPINLRVSVTRHEPRLITIKSASAPLHQIAAQLSAQLKIPIHVSPLLRKQTPELELENWTLDHVARQLAPIVYADTETKTDGSAPRVLALYLQAVNEPLPLLEASLPRANSVVLIEGSTDDEPEPSKEDKGEVDEKQPLSVVYRQGLLSLHAKEQPLRTVLEAVAARLNVACDTQQAASEKITMTLTPNAPVEILRKLSAQLVLYQRHDWRRGEQVLLRIVATSPASRPRSEED